MSAADEIRAELDLENQRQAKEEVAAQAQIVAATEGRTVFADPTDDHIKYFNYVESNGFLATFFESLLVNFGPNPDPGVEAAFQRDLYYDAAGFTSSDAATDHRMQLVLRVQTPPPLPEMPILARESLLFQIFPAVAAAPWRGFMNVPMKFTAKDLPESPAICIKILIKLRPLQRERRHL